MNILTIDTVSKKPADYGSICATREVIAGAISIGNPGAIAASEVFERDGLRTVRYYFDPIWPLDLEYIAAYLKLAMGRWFERVAIVYQTGDGPQRSASWVKGTKPNREELLALYRVVENELSPENLTCDGERKPSKRHIAKLEKRRDVIIKALGGEPSFEEAYP